MTESEDKQKPKREKVILTDTEGKKVNKAIHRRVVTEEIKKYLKKPKD